MNDKFIRTFYDFFTLVEDSKGNKVVPGVYKLVTISQGEELLIKDIVVLSDIQINNLQDNITKYNTIDDDSSTFIINGSKYKKLLRG